MANSAVKIENLVKTYNPQNVWIIYVGLLPDISSLPLTKQEKKIIDDYKKLQALDFSTDYKIYKNFKEIGDESIIMFSYLDMPLALKYLEELKDIKIQTTGKDLQNFGINPSPEYQKCFDYILEEKLKNPALSKEQEIELMKKYFKI